MYTVHRLRRCISLQRRKRRRLFLWATSRRLHKQALTSPLPGGPSAVNPKEVLAQIRAKEVRAVDLRFMDFPGLWQHFTIPAEALNEHVFEEGLGIDGSSIRGWVAINESDRLVVSVSDTAFLDPFCRDRTLTMSCNIQDPL